MLFIDQLVRSKVTCSFKSRLPSLVSLWGDCSNETTALTKGCWLPTTAPFYTPVTISLRWVSHKEFDPFSIMAACKALLSVTVTALLLGLSATSTRRSVTRYGTWLLL